MPALILFKICRLCCFTVGRNSDKAAVKLKKTFLIKRVFLICLMKGKCKANQTFPVLQCFSSHIPLVMAVF